MGKDQAVKNKAVPRSCLSLRAFELLSKCDEISFMRSCNRFSHFVMLRCIQCRLLSYIGEQRKEFFLFSFTTFTMLKVSVSLCPRIESGWEAPHPILTGVRLQL